LKGSEKILAYNIDQVMQIVLQHFFMISLNNQAVLLNKISQSDHTKNGIPFSRLPLTHVDDFKTG